MHIHFLDSYRPGDSLIHRLEARIKFILTIAFILTTALTPQDAWPVYLLLLTIVLSVIVLSDLGVGTVLKRAMLAIPFILAALPTVFTLKGEVAWQVSLGSLEIRFYQPGLVRFVSIALKSWLSVQAAIVLASTTQFTDLLMAMRAVGVPRLMVAIFSLMWRYLFVLADEALRLMRARAARSGQSDRPDLKPGGNFAWRTRITGGMAGSLFIRAIERSDRIYNAMLARGYDGEVRSRPLPKFELIHWLMLIGGLLALVCLLGLAHFGF